MYGQLLLLALLAAISMPILAQFPETTAALGPPSISLLVGAFVFGLCMQIADGCGSGTLYKAGLGVPLNMAILPLFALGSFLGSVHLNDLGAHGICRHADRHPRAALFRVLKGHASMSTTASRRWIFWLALIGFVAWDFTHSAPVNLRLEPPIIAAGSGTASQGGHCAMPK